MLSLRKASCFIILLTWIFVPAVAQEKDERFFRSEKVDEIYQNIRYSQPVYDWEERIVTFENEGLMLVNSLVLPRANKRCPIILVLNGFAGDRKEVLMPGSNEYFWERISRIFAENGLATLRIDFRGSGDSDGEFTMTTFSTQISDAMAAVEFICRKLRREVFWRSIGILGFSQGGLVAASTASRDDRVDSVVLWSPVSHAPIVYEGLLTKEGIRQGLALPEGDTVTLPIYVDGQYVNWDVPLGKKFFQDIYHIDPVAEINKNYRGPLMTICGRLDPIIWPQPHMSELYLRHHEGFEKMVILDGDHAFNWWDGPNPEKFHDAIYWSAAWFLYTLD